MKPRRREFSTNNLSFLDIMSCGLGAAVLLFLIIKHDQVRIEQEVKPADAETALLEREVLEGQRYLAELLNSRDLIDDEIASSRNEISRIEGILAQLEAELQRLRDNEDLTVTDLERQIEGLEQQIAQISAEQATGLKARTFLGDGQRQYLTGVNLGGEYILILLDASASMLDDTIVNVIRRRNRDTDTQLASEKWVRAVRIVDWLTANLPIDSQVQIVAFNTEARTMLGSPGLGWVPVRDSEVIDAAVAELQQTPPTGGTSLHAAINAMRSLSPQPDNIFLITDGLPTQGANPPRGSTVDGRQRVNFFNDAIEDLPSRVPVNTMLLPMEGDPLAAAAFWKLAIQSRGSFMTPASDWP